MSLLMQALKKAERAKQSHLHDDELVKPSDELDEGLSLQPHAPSQAPSLSLEPTDEPTLEPAFRPATPVPEYAGAGLSLTPLGEEPPTLTDSLPPPPSPAAQQAEPQRPQAAAAQSRAQPRTAPPPKARPAAPAKASPWSSLSPETIRLGILGGIALLILCIFAYIYWRAINAPGAGSKLPMVAMPPQQLSPVPGGPGGLGQGVVVAPPTDGVAPGAGIGLASSTTPTTELPVRQPGERPSPAYVPESARNPVLRSAPSPELGYTTRERPLSTADLPAEEDPALREAGRSPGAADVRASRSQATSIASADADIRVRRSDNAPRTNPSLQTAYQAFNGGDLPLARQQYSAVLRQEPNNRDALLGSAAVALRDNQPAQAAAQYMRLLELDPNDADAVAGLSGLRQGDPQQLESRLRAVVERSPDAAPALFALGNLYAQQSRWPEAQQAYFRAFSSAPDNPDYAFNLAIGLDRLNQGKLALGYYQRALALSTNTPAMFDRAALRRRLHELTVAAGVAPTAAP